MSKLKNSVHGQKEKRKGGKSPKRITMSLKMTDDVWYAILQYRTLTINSFLRRKNISTTTKIFTLCVEKLQPYT